MAWIGNQTGNSRRGRTGVQYSHSETRTGSRANMLSKDAAAETSPNSSASPTTRFTSGSTSMESEGGPHRRQGNSSDGARLVPTTPCGTSVASSTLDGSAESHLSDKRSTTAMSGSKHALSCGSEIARAAVGAVSVGKIGWICRSTSTTSSHSPSVCCVQIHRTWCFYARCATTSSIHGGM